MKPTDLKCRPQVAAVIGEAYADHELQRVIDCEECYVDEGKEELFDSFSWSKSPQKNDFWSLIYDGKTPYEHGHEKPELSEITHTNSDKIGACLNKNPALDFSMIVNVPESEPRDKERSDGSTASYYELPECATELQHLISHRNMNAQIGEIVRACYRYGLVSHSDMLRDAKKIKFYAQAEIERLEKLAQSDK